MAIIGIAGSIGSGKDSIGSIIQQLQPTRNWQIKKFAGKLKQIATILTGIPSELFEDQEFKKTNLPLQWDQPQYFEGMLLRTVPMTVRDMLQRLGTEALRENLHKEVWINALFADFKCTTIAQGHDEFDVLDVDVEPSWVITDLRFPNEFNAIKSRGGTTIRVTRPLQATTNAAFHSSETSLDSHTFDFEILNDGTLEDLQEKVKKVLGTL